MNVDGSNDGVNLGTGDSLTANGGADAISAGGTGDQIALNGAGYVVSGDAASVSLGNESSAQLNTGGDAVALSANDTVTLDGGSDAVSAGVNDSVALNGGNYDVTNGGSGSTFNIADTDGQFDTVDASSDTVKVAISSQANIYGNNDTVDANAGDSVGTYGGDNLINAGEGEDIVVGNTNGSADEIVDSGDVTGQKTNNGQNTGIGIASNSQATIVGNNDSITENSSDSVFVAGQYDSVSDNSSDRVEFLSGEAGDGASTQTTVTTVSTDPFSTDVGDDGDASDDTLGDPSCTSGSYEEEVVGYDDDGNAETEDVYVADPVILNLTGQLVQTTDLINSNAYFDMQNDGQKIQTGWATAGEGMLVYDPQGTNTVTQDSNLVAGFSVLDTMDTNHDGKLDGNDAGWANLKVWVDQSGTAAFNSGSLYSMAQLGITSINLGALQVDQNSNGNTILDDSTFTFANGTTGDIAGVDLVSNPNAVAPQTGTADAHLNSLVAAMSAIAPSAAVGPASNWNEPLVPHAVIAASMH